MRTNTERTLSISGVCLLRNIARTQKTTLTWASERLQVPLGAPGPRARRGCSALHAGERLDHAERSRG